MLIKVDGKRELEFIGYWTGMTENLIKMKGFSIDKEDTIEKISLIHTEVAELTDAFKKGKGKVAEGEELADILIRLMNVPCLFPGIAQKAMDFLSDGAEYGHHFLTKAEMVYCTGIEDWKNQYTGTYCLHDVVTELGTLCVQHLAGGKKELHILRNLQAIVTLCRMYSEQFLNNADIDDLVKSKMAINLERPYRYNTDPKLFNNN